jgi:hypothetical protein
MKRHIQRGDVVDVYTGLTNQSASAVSHPAFVHVEVFGIPQAPGDCWEFYHEGTDTMIVVSGSCVIQRSDK